VPQSAYPQIGFNIMAVLENPQVAPQVSPQVKSLIKILKKDMSRQEILATLDLKDRKSLRQRYLVPVLSMELIEMTIPDKPNSSFQKYRLTPKAKLV
jgi:Filamentation induced by cAMP protein Fic-like, C-terminal domain